MKKILAMILMGALLLPACGQVKPDAQESPAPADTELKFPPVVKVETLKAYRFTEDGETELAEVWRDSMSLSGAGYEKAAEAVERLLSATQEAVDQDADLLAEDALEHYNDVKEDEYFFSPYSSDSSYEITRMDTQVLSVRNWGYDYEGGAHGMGANWGTTIDLVNGLELELPHLMNNFSGFIKRAEEIVLAELSTREDELFEDYAAYVSANFENVSWYLDGAGVEFVFTPYEIGPYSSGTITVCVPYGDVAEYMKEEYCGLQGAAVGELPKYRVTTVELAEDAGDVAIGLQIRQDSQGIDEFVISINGQENVIGEYVYIQHAYFLRRPEGRGFLVFDIDWASDDYETFVQEVADGKLEAVDNIGGRIDSKNVNLESLNLCLSLDVFGTRQSEMEYALTEEGKLVQTGEKYEFPVQNQWNGLTTVRELPVTVDGQKTTLPAGTALRIVATDNEGTAWFETEEGVSGEIHYQRSEEFYEIMIDGVSEFEYFENLPYAG